MTIKIFIQILASVLVFLFALGWGILQFISLLLDKLASVQSDLSKALIAASTTILAAVITLVAGKIWEQRLKIRDEIRAKKIPIYEKHIATFFKVFFAPKIGGRQLDQKEIATAFAAFSEQMITWGSSDVIKAWNNFRGLDSSATEQKRIDTLEGIFRAIRKDAGNPVWDLPKGELLRLFVNDVPGGDHRS